jgi:DNA-binding MurR/RpiR family transcriptional regulator
MVAGVPTDVAQIKQRALAAIGDYSELSKRVLTVALAQPDTVAFGTLKTLSAASGVSQGTVLRTIRRLGFTSFAEFKTPFQNALRRPLDR